MKFDDREFCSLSALKHRGWTLKMVEHFLGVPDSLGVNPYYRDAAPVKLFLLAKVKKVEDTEEFKALKNNARRKKKPDEMQVNSRSVTE